MAIVAQGDALTLSLDIGDSPEGGPATPENSRAEFAIKLDRYAEHRHRAGVPATLWRAGWDSGVAPGANPGRVSVTIPERITREWPRGSYEYALAVSDRLGMRKATRAQGAVLVDATAASHNPLPEYRQPHHKHPGGRCDA
jgi:hypothetical protein